MKYSWLGRRYHTIHSKYSNKPRALYDTGLIIVVLVLMILGLMMVASSSVMIATKYYHQPFYFLLHQFIYIIIGCGAALVVVRVDIRYWEQWSVPLLLLCCILLCLVLVPGIGRIVGGGRRWLAFGPIGIQVSEIVKMAMIFYVADYIVRQRKQFEQSIIGFITPIVVLSVVAFLLLLEPDFGAVVVITSTVMAMLFLTNVKLRYYFGIVLVIGVLLAIIAISSPYRIARLTAFLNPWADQFNSGYQLTQSLIAFGRGGWFGLGLGESVQKLSYLPEAHTDFLFAVLAEELGLVGVFLVLLLYSIIVMKGFWIGLRAYARGRFFAAYTAYGITFWLGLQAAVNIGVNAGMLPTKGLTLPLMSYGGASIVISCVVIAILLRIDYENRQEYGYR